MSKSDSKFYNIYVYTLIYSTFGILSSTYHACFTSSLSTLEKRYHFSSSTAAYIMIADNIALLIINIFIGYYGKTVHKPRWMAFGCALSGVSVMVTALPFLLFGSIEEQELESLTRNVTLAQTRISGDQLCLAQPIEEDCRNTVAAGSVTMIAIACFFFSNFFRGFGSSIYFTYGIPYLDDNINKADMPAFFSFIFAAKIFGSPLGFALTSLFLKLYENPLKPPIGLSDGDPRWIGAWWVGFLISGFLMILLAIPMSLFPREFKKKQIKSKEEVQLVAESTTKYNSRIEPVSSAKLEDSEGKELSLKHLPAELYDIIKNPLIICQMLGNVCRGLGIAGYFVFQSRYLESQFRQPAAKASLLTGTTGILPKIMGIVFGGIFISLLRPKPRKLTTFLFIVEATSVFCLMYASTVHGPTYSFPFTTKNNNLLELNNECNRKCNCDHVRYQPVCEYSGTNTYFSPCHAGCNMSFKVIDGGSTFTGCDCIQSNTKSLEKCSSDSDRLIEYVSVIAIGVMIAGSARSGNMVTFFRCIKPEQKSLATALKSFIYSLFVSIPYPIIYGRMFDGTCLVWSKECGKRGNCWLYDVDKLRVSFHTLSIVLIAIGSFFDLVMIFLSPRLGNLYDDEEDESSFMDRLLFWRSKSKKAKRAVSKDDISVGRPSKLLITSL